MRLRAPHPRRPSGRSPADGGATRCRSPPRTSGPASRRRAALPARRGETTVTIRGQRQGGAIRKWRSPPRWNWRKTAASTSFAWGPTAGRPHGRGGRLRLQRRSGPLRAIGLHPKESLDANDSYPLLLKAGTLPHRPHAHQCHGYDHHAGQAEITEQKTLLGLSAMYKVKKESNRSRSRPAGQDGVIRDGASRKSAGCGQARSETHRNGIPSSVSGAETARGFNRYGRRSVWFMVFLGSLALLLGNFVYGAFVKKYSEFQGVHAGQKPARRRGLH